MPRRQFRRNETNKKRAEHPRSNRAAVPVPKWFTRPDEVPAQPREGLLRADRNELLPLKNGGHVEASLGQALLRMLEGLLERHPDDFHALLAIIEGRTEEAPSARVEALKEAMLLRPDGSVIPGLRDVLLSAYQQTQEGPVLVNPFQLESNDQARALEQAEEEGYLRLAREIRKRKGRNDEGQTP